MTLFFIKFQQIQFVRCWLSRSETLGEFRYVIGRRRDTGGLILGTSPPIGARLFAFIEIVSVLFFEPWHQLFTDILHAGVELRLRESRIRLWDFCSGLC